MKSARARHCGVPHCDQSMIWASASAESAGPSLVVGGIVPSMTRSAVRVPLALAEL